MFAHNMLIIQYNRNYKKLAVKVIEQKGGVAAAHGRFNRILQMAPMCTPSNTCFLVYTRVHIPNDIAIGSQVYAGLTIVTDRPTDRPPSVTICRIYVRSAAMRPKNRVILRVRPWSDTVTRDPTRPDQNC